MKYNLKKVGIFNQKIIEVANIHYTPLTSLFNNIAEMRAHLFDK